jgi:hypothetical protein
VKWTVERPLREPRSAAFGNLNNANLANSGLDLHSNAATKSRFGDFWDGSGCLETAGAGPRFKRTAIAFGSGANYGIVYERFPNNSTGVNISLRRGRLS